MLTATPCRTDNAAVNVAEVWYIQCRLHLLPQMPYEVSYDDIETDFGELDWMSRRVGLSQSRKHEHRSPAEEMVSAKLEGKENRVKTRHCAAKM